MYSVDEIKELLKAFDTSKATKIEIKTEKGETLTIAQKTEETASFVPAAVKIKHIPYGSGRMIGGRRYHDGGGTRRAAAESDPGEQARSEHIRRG